MVKKEILKYKVDNLNLELGNKFVFTVIDLAS